MKEAIGVEIQNACNNKNSCHECIQTANCAWCTTPNYRENRCFHYGLDSSCPKESIFFPKTSYAFIRNRPLTSESTTAHNAKAARNNTREIVQLRPQRMSLRLRANEVYTTQLTYSRADDYPVDLYYLMDLSDSMRDDKSKLSALGNSLAETMSNITSNFRLGFGSFIDKVRMPFTAVSKSFCAKKYSYRNVMPLSNNTYRFASQVENAVIGANIDSPEGGLDAMMQAIVCRKEIGWREKARHLLVFSTDANFHSAGDGKLAGLIKPNDAKCHLDGKGYYTHAEILDYPSVGAIRHQIKENSINVIFAVTNTQFDRYRLLSNQIEGSSCAKLTKDSSNVVNIVREQYQQISSTIQILDNATHHVKVSYYSTCGTDGAARPTSKCDGVRIGDKITFTVNISIQSCPADPRDWQQIIQIYPVGINESLIIDLEMLCGCECESQKLTLSAECSSHGSLVCGVCVCDEKYIGAQCECSSANVQANNGNSHFCHDNSTFIDCSGRGICSCGICQCDQRSNAEEVISGRYCQCDNFSCERYERKICSGAEHGTCECGKCDCKPGWTGPACECQVSTESCRPPDGGEICSGKGTCECGVCKCQTTAQGRYSGQYCEMCPTCSSRCSEIKHCVQCQLYDMGKLKDKMDCANNCSNVKTTALEKDVFEKYELVKGEKKCVFYDDEYCKFSFIFQEMDGTDEVRALKERECLSKVALLGILGGVAGAILGVGLATLLLWKAITTIQDHREYQRFEEEQLKAKWNSDHNPLYKQAISTFKNPLYPSQ
ncbi:integrin beta-PS-like [Anastrepha ludens]|uniref:integrin beta-PS-like n=1 Tax=Anastrepha ludens TaxID=28586 RepID=UPI0023B13735|nr:integrin beta-PS-like [Anastrepha ludens]